MNGTLALIRDPYRFISRQFDGTSKDVLKTRLLFKNAFLLHGKTAVEVFHDTELFEHQATVPGFLERQVFGAGGLREFSGQETRESPWVELDFLTRRAIDGLCVEVRTAWNAALNRWSKGCEVVLLEEMKKVMLVAGCAWCGIPISVADIEEKGDQFGRLLYPRGNRMVPRTAASKAQREIELWLANVMELASKRQLETEFNSHIMRLANWKDAKGAPVSDKRKVRLLLALLKQVIDLSRYIVFAAIALEKNQDLFWYVEQDDSLRESFAYEVIRYYPAAPFLTATVKQDFVWNDITLVAGGTALLDIYGHNRDRRVWADPHEFQAERFLRWTGEPLHIISRRDLKGSCTNRSSHERMVILVVKEALRMFACEFDYYVPAQDLSISLSRVPAVPETGVVIGDVRARATFGQTLTQR